MSVSLYKEVIKTHKCVIKMILFVPE